MRFLLLFFVFSLGPVTAFAETVAGPNGLPEVNTSAAAASIPACPMGALCSQKSSMSRDWSDQISNLDLMQDEMKRLRLSNFKVKVGVVDTGASKALTDEHSRGKIDYNPMTKDSFDIGKLPLGMSIGDLLKKLPSSNLVKAWDDDAQHGTAVTEMIRRLSPGDIELIPTAGRTQLSPEELNRAVEMACEKSKIVNVSWNSENQGHTFKDCHSLQERMLDKGCLVLIAAGNSGGKNMDCFTSTMAMDRFGHLALLDNGKLATKGDLYAPGERVPVKMKIHPTSFPQCDKETFLVSGSSVASPETTAVAKNVADILMQTGEFRDGLTPRAQATLIDQILRQSAVNSRLDGYRAVKLAETCSKLDQVSQCVNNLRFQAHRTWGNMQAGTHDPGQCASKSDCGARMTCYKDKRRWLAGVDPTSSLGQNAIKDLFVTAQNSGDYELAANWAEQVKANKGEMDGLVDWNEFRKRTQNPSNPDVIVQYLSTVMSFTSVPADIQQRFLPTK